MDEVALRLLDDLPYFAKHNLKIKPKTGNFMPFRFNKAQLHIHQRLEEQKRLTGRVRAIILKGRQQGCSTYVAARYYHQTVSNKATVTFIFAHDSEASQSLFSMVNNYYQLSDPAFRPKLGASNAKELLFPDMRSGYKVGTAGTKGLGRSKTFQQVHWSEVAYSPNCSEHAAGILQTVSDQKGTEVILESTANGQGDYFHRMCKMALVGESDYQLIFVPWYWQDEYTRPLEEPFDLDAEETEYLNLFKKDGLSKEHLAWRRKKIRSDFEGDSMRFKREYPFTPEEAFEANDEHALIKANSVRKARMTPAVNTTAPLVIGVDPARLGGDKFRVTHRKGRNVTKSYSIAPMSITDSARVLSQDIVNYKPGRLFIDCGGLGVGIYDMLCDMGYSKLISKVDFGSKASNPDRYYNKRAEMYGEAKEWLENEPCSIQLTEKDGDALQSELCSVHFEWRNNSQILLEPKEKHKERLGHSPDIADSFVLTFAEPVAQTNFAPRMSEAFTAPTWTVF
tara:strand:+ start:5030 stop:6556 length:1527 start_codon:yes stop_codon:yes gene_type:complete